MEVTEPIRVRCSTLVMRDDSVLLCHRTSDAVWVLPGGAPRRDESPVACAERETEQETGLAVRAQGVAFVLDVTSPRGDQHLFEMIWAASDESGERVPCSQEADLEPAFIALDSLDSLDLRPQIAARLRTFGELWSSSRDRPPLAPYLGNFWDEAASPVGSGAHRTSAHG